MKRLFAAFFTLAIVILYPVLIAGQTVEERAWAIIRELIKDPEVVIVDDEVQAGELDGPSGDHADYQVSTKIEPGSPEYEAKVSKLREKRRRDLQAKLVELGPPAVPTVCSALTDQTLPYREYLAQALEMIHDVKAAPCLIEYLNEGLTRLRMADTLEKHGEVELAAAERKTANVVVESALSALRTISGVDCGRDVAKWRSWWRQYKNYYNP